MFQWGPEQLARLSWGSTATMGSRGRMRGTLGHATGYANNTQMQKTYKQCNEEDDSCSEEKNKDKKVKSWWVKSTAGEVLAECFVCWEQCPEVQIPMSATHYNPKCDAPSVTGYKKKLEWNVKAMMSLPRHLLNVLPYKTSTRWQTCQSGMTALILGCLVKVDPLGSDEDGCIVGVLGGRPPGERRYDTIVSHTTTPGQDKGGGGMRHFKEQRTSGNIMQWCI